MPWVRYGIPLFIGGQEMESRCSIDTGVVYGQVYLHLKMVGKERFVDYSRFVKSFFTGYPANTMYMVVDAVTRGQSIGIGLCHMHRNVGAPIETLL